MSLGDATAEEAALANVIVEMFQTPISGEGKRELRREVERAKGRRQKEERGDVGVKEKRAKRRKGDGRGAGIENKERERINKRGTFIALFSPGSE